MKLDYGCESWRAREARERGERPLSEVRKELPEALRGLTEDELSQRGFITSCGWHHQGEDFSKVPFFSLGKAAIESFEEAGVSLEEWERREDEARERRATDYAASCDALMARIESGEEVPSATYRVTSPEGHRQKMNLQWPLGEREWGVRAVGGFGSKPCAIVYRKEEERSSLVLIFGAESLSDAEYFLDLDTARDATRGSRYEQLQ